MNHSFWLRILLIIAVFIFSQAGAYLVLSLLGIAGEDYSSVIINTVFLISTVCLVRGLHLSAEKTGLKVIKERLLWHVTVCLAITLLYLAYYVFVVRISGLRPVSANTLWGALNYLIVVFAEEIFFRGIIYGVVQNQYSGRMAVFISALLFGLAHARQGLAIIPRFFTGWLWGSVRYSSGMIFLLIIPVHLIYNVVWLFFEGNWESQALWAVLIPLIELLMGTSIMMLASARANRPSSS